MQVQVVQIKVVGYHSNGDTDNDNRILVVSKDVFVDSPRMIEIICDHLNEIYDDPDMTIGDDFEYSVNTQTILS